MMTKHQREHVRLSLLRYCEASGPYGLAAPTLLQFIRNEGFRQVTEQDLDAEISYLVDKHLMVSVDKVISPENVSWRVTAMGRDFIAKQFED